MKKYILSILLIAVIALQSCKKDAAPKTNNGGGTDNGDGTIIAGTDPGIANTQGFFLDNWVAKTFTAPNTVNAAKPSASGAVSVTVDLSQVTTKVSKYLFGNNTNPYMGQYVTEPVLMGNLTALAPNILRAPGGSLSDIYFWNGDGSTVAAPADAPANLVDVTGASKPAGYWFGNNTQSWTFTVDNYYKVLQQTNSTGLIVVNYGYARYGTSDHPDQTAAHLAANWVRYDKGKTQYWDIGNENYGNWEAGYRIDRSLNKDGQPEYLTGTLYGTHFKVFADSMRKAAAEVGNTGIKIGAVLTSSNDVNNNAGVTNWNADVLKATGNSPDYFVVHNYYTPYNDNTTADVILATPSSQTTAMMSWVKTSVTNAGVTQKPVALDEWNIQATGSSQNVSNIAGLHAVMTLGEVLKSQFSMASRWDLANGWDSGNDQGMFNIGDEVGIAKWNPRPAFYYMYFFEKYFGDRMVSATTGTSSIACYGSSFSSGEAGVVLVNKANFDQVVTVTIKNFAAGTKYYYYTLNGGSDNAPFSHQVFVNGVGPANGTSGGPDTYAAIAASSASISGGITVNVPKYGAVFLVADKK
ncbi:alpha-L-arabinofuranosidase [Mucilaginibacter sp. BJC16-A38]|uniref:alpha-L-arabinofuranosidase n=1 Tax=Mucilaginibacter phenanthrenivorans TaxID=1234842 RepID=UPI0021584CEE|nr:alpha-L-arabinofuranosidase [Mucilaginibacter phenanthrenivorans]MCR8558059.1 alpha-L-arabinofuranosidase [Mucilaginibacter phenanthrenivorans]